MCTSTRVLFVPVTSINGKVEIQLDEKNPIRVVRVIRITQLSDARSISTATINKNLF